MKTCMRYLAVVFAVAMLVCALSSVSAGFPDVENTHKHASAIETMTNLGIIGGYEDGTFRPDGLVRRDEMAKIIFAFYTMSTDAGEGTTTFPDVPKNSWAKGYISWCANKEIVGGYEDGTFRPAGNITYDEALKMVCAALGYTDFDPELWPIDVRIKGLNELKLGDELEDIAGSDALTRAQVVQLVYNAFDKPMYTEPQETTDSPIGQIIMGEVASSSSIKDSVWKVKEIDAQIIGTENYGFIDADKGVFGEKTENDNEILVRFNYSDGTAENKTIKLSDVGLDSYAGKTDSLITYYISIIQKAETDAYISASLKGVSRSGISGGWAPTAGRPVIYCYNQSTNGWADRYGVIVDGIVHTDENFWNIRRLTYFEDYVVATLAHDTEDTTLDPRGYFQVRYSWQTNGYNKWNENIGFSMTQGMGLKKWGIDADSDGYYDYLTVEPAELFRVKKITNKNIEFEWLYKDSKDWKPTPDYTYTDAAGVSHTLSLDLVFPKENVSMMKNLEEGDIVQGYQLGDTFVVTNDTTVHTGYGVKYDKSNIKITLNTGTTIEYNYSSWNVWVSHDFNGKQVQGVIEGLTPIVGVNGSTGTFNYAKYWTINNKAVWAEAIDAEAAGGSTGGHKKAILLYVTEATEPQVNETTKVNEVFYPAYLLINGRTQLVNLNATYAIDKFSAASVAQDGSPYRPTVVSDNGVDRIMYANLLVTYTVDDDGYYTLHTDSTTYYDENNEIVEKVIAADPDNAIVIDKSTGIVSIVNNGNTVETGIVIGDGTILYYPYTLASTGAHEYIEFYLGSEIPSDFAETKITSDIYLTVDEETGLWLLGTLVLESELGGSSKDKDNYAKDAREHLYATTDKEAELVNDEIYASYSFKALSTYADTTSVNKLQKYADSLDVTKGGIYAWDSKAKNYVAIDDTMESYSSNETITKVIGSMNVIFTTSYTSGIKVDDDTKIIALVENDEGEIETQLVTFSELVDQLSAVEQYNEDNNTAKTLTTAIGTYTDDNDATRIAYLLVTWEDLSED